MGIKPSLLRVLHKIPVKQNKSALIEFLEPQQLALSEAGGFKLVHCVRMLMEKRRDFVCVKVDMRNAHNEVSRASVIEALDREPTLRHLALHIRVGHTFKIMEFQFGCPLLLCET